MKIPLFKPRIREEAIQAVADVLRSGWIGLGPVTAEFERQFAEFIGTPHCVALNSCTSALHLCLCLQNLPRDAEVITTPVTFVSTNHAILYEGLVPVFADIDPRTGCLDPADVRRRITERTGAIMLVHFGGCPAELDEFYAIGKEFGIPIIEDCAHACGASYRGRRIGSTGTCHAFSFHAVKNLPMGDGGAITVPSVEADQRLRSLRWLGIDRSTFERSRESTRQAYKWEYAVQEVGFKYHMNDISAAIGLAQLEVLDAENERRRELALLYDQELAGTPGIRLTRYPDDRVSSRHLYWVLAEQRDGLVDALRAHGIDCGVHYARNDQYAMYEEAELPQVAEFCARVISLPLYLDLTEDDVAMVCQAIRKGW